MLISSSIFCSCCYSEWRNEVPSLCPDQWSAIMHSLLINSECQAPKEPLSALSPQRIHSRLNSTDFLSSLVSLCFFVPSRFSLSSLMILLHILCDFSLSSAPWDHWIPCSVQCPNPFSNKLVWAESVPTHLGEKECYNHTHTEESNCVEVVALSTFYLA